MHHHHFHHGENALDDQNVSDFKKRVDPPKRKGSYYAVHPDDFHGDDQ